MAASFDPEAWLADRVAEIEALRGRTALRWTGHEQALDWEEDDVGTVWDLVWRHRDVPMLQFADIAIVFSDESRTFCTYQGYDGWGLMLTEPWPARTSQDGIWRTREVTELPLGVIDDVRVVVRAARPDERFILRVELTMGGRVVSLVAGEVYPNNEGIFSVTDFDENVLVQLDGKRP